MNPGRVQGSSNFSAATPRPGAGGGNGYCHGICHVLSASGCPPSQALQVDSYPLVQRDSRWPHLLPAARSCRMATPRPYLWRPREYAGVIHSAFRPSGRALFIALYLKATHTESGMRNIILFSMVLILSAVACSNTPEQLTPTLETPATIWEPSVTWEPALTTWATPHDEFGEDKLILPVRYFQGPLHPTLDLLDPTKHVTLTKQPNGLYYGTIGGIEFMVEWSWEQIY